MNRNQTNVPTTWRMALVALAAVLFLALTGAAVYAQEELFLPFISKPTTGGTIPPPPSQTPASRTTETPGSTQTATPVTGAPTSTPTDTPTDAPGATATPTPTPHPGATSTATSTSTATATATSISTATATATQVSSGSGSSVRFFGNGRDAIDRITIRIDGPARPADVGATDFTIEFWIKAASDDNTGSVTCGANDGWITGNVLFDRDIYFAGDHGDFGIALNDGKVAFGLSVGSSGTTLCGGTEVDDNQWHHVAVTRQPDGDMALFVDGQPDGSTRGASGDASYRNGRSTSYTWDPYIVLGAEKHDAGSAYPSFNGWLDELRISNTVRYTAAFTPPAAPFATDGSTMALYHFDEGSGTSVADSSGASGGPTNGAFRVGGSPSGPVWSMESPF